MSEEYSVGYNEGYQTGRNEAIDELEQENRLLRARNTRLEAETQPAPMQEPVALEEYDAGILNDYGGGNVDWWQDYIRAELGRAYEHYQSQTIITPPAAQRQWVGLSDEQKLSLEIQGGKSDVMLAELVEGWLKEKNL